jgi:hypothetical protein
MIEIADRVQFAAESIYLQLNPISSIDGKEKWERERGRFWEKEREYGSGGCLV